MRTLAMSVALAIGVMASADPASAQNIYSGGRTGAYYGTLCPAIADGLRPEGFVPSCVETKGTIDNIQLLLNDPSGLALVQADAYAAWAAANPDQAKKLVTLRSDLAREGVYFVSKNIAEFGDMVRFITRIKLVLPPKGSGPAQTFENLKATLPRVFAKLEASQIVYAESATKAIEMALTTDNTIALFVQMPDPENENFRLIVDKKGHFIAVVARSIVDQKIGDQAVYTVETRPVKAGGMFTSGLEVTTLATPVMVVAQSGDGLQPGSNARANYDDMVKAIKTLPRERFLPKTGSAASLFSRAWTATESVTRDLIERAQAEINKL